MRGLLRALLGVAAVWSLAVILIFIVSAVTHRWPRSLELPWSAVSDFVVTPEGSAVLYSEFFQRLLVYDLEGRFLGTQPGVPARGEHYLATDVRGRVYISSLGSVCIVHVGEEVEDVPVCRRGPPGTVGWRVEEAGVEPVVGRPPAPPPDRPAEVGETLFSYVGDYPVVRHQFHAAGAEIVRQGDCLLVRNGEEAQGGRICSPWYLYWANFPVPAVFAWILLIALSIAERRRHSRKPGDLEKSFGEAGR